MSHRPSREAFMSCTIESWLPRKVNPGGGGGVSANFPPADSNVSVQGCFKDIPPPASVSWGCGPPAVRGGCLLAFLLQAMHNKQVCAASTWCSGGLLWDAHTDTAASGSGSYFNADNCAMVFRLGETWTLPFARMRSVSKLCCYQPVYSVTAVPGHWSLPITAALRSAPPHRSRSRSVTFCLHLTLSSCLICLLGPTPESQQQQQQQQWGQISAGELRPWIGARPLGRSPRFHGWFRV